MKKKIVSIISAMVLICAMSLNVFAEEGSGSVTSKDVVEAAGKVEVPATEEALTDSAKVANSIIVFTESVEGLTTSTLEVKDVLPIAEELAKLDSQSDIASVNVVAVVELTSAAAGKVVVEMNVGPNEIPVALHATANGVERIIGTVSGNKVTFDFGSFSPVAIIKVQKAGNTSPSNNNNNSNTSSDAGNTTTTDTTTDAATPVAPKTGDMSMMVTVMALIFMVGAAVALSMSKKRA